MFIKTFLNTFTTKSKNMNGFINHTTKQINDLTDTIYEELFEDNSEKLIIAIDELIDLLTSLKKDNKDEA